MTSALTYCLCWHISTSITWDGNLQTWHIWRTRSFNWSLQVLNPTLPSEITTAIMSPGEKVETYNETVIESWRVRGVNRRWSYQAAKPIQDTPRYVFAYGQGDGYGLVIYTYITLHYNTLHYITLHHITSHYVILNDITLHYTTLHYIALYTYIYTDVYWLNVLFIGIIHSLHFLIPACLARQSPATGLFIVPGSHSPRDWYMDRWFRQESFALNSHLFFWSCGRTWSGWILVIFYTFPHILMYVWNVGKVGLSKDWKDSSELYRNNQPMWLKPCHVYSPWLGLVTIPPIYGEIGDGLLLFKPH